MAFLRQVISDNRFESRLFLGRTVFAVVFIALLTLGLVARLGYLQIVAHEHFSTLSRDNRVKLEALPPTRGLIYDRNGVLLAENLPTYSLELIPEQIENLDDTLGELAKIIPIAEADLNRFRKLRGRMRRFDPIPLRFQLSDTEVALFAVNRHRFPGVDIRARLTRHYPMGPLTSHVLGYVGRIDSDELTRLDSANYRGTNHIGKTGIEKAYEDALHGTAGWQNVETNAVGRELRVLQQHSPTPGADLYLDLDIRVQAEAVSALGEYNGAVVALDAETGGVLALVSQPAFDPNLFVNGIDVETYRQLNTSGDKPLFNRAIRGQYPPGSTLKPFIGLAALHYGATQAEKQHYCPGYFQLPNQEHKYRDWKKEGHGWLNLDQAIMRSCDVYFYELSMGLGIEHMSEFLSRFGLGRKTGIDLGGEQAGLLPSPEWKRRRYGEPWFPGETLITVIGQGFSLVTPLQLANATAIMGRRGVVTQPRTVRAIQSHGQGKTNLRDTPGLAPITDVADALWQSVIHSMERVVHHPRGTAHRIGSGVTYHMAGKTGTAQVFSVKQDEEYDEETIARKLRDHALFIAFAPVENPKIAIAVIVENGGSGSSVAAPIARRVMDLYLNGRSP